MSWKEWVKEWVEDIATAGILAASNYYFSATDKMLHSVLTIAGTVPFLHTTEEIYAKGESYLFAIERKGLIFPRKYGHIAK